MRLIDDSALWSDIQMLPHNGDIISSEEVEQAIANAPTIDAVPVVRCRDCKRCVKHGDYFVCDHALPTKSMEQLLMLGSNIKAVVELDDFCSHGERRVAHETD